MSFFKDCIDGIIGLSETECSCFDTDKPADYNESESGLFLDQLEGISGNIILATEDCSQGSMWDLMTKARTEAIKHVLSDLQASIKQSYKSKHPIYKGFIGHRSYTKNITPDDDTIGMALKCSLLKGQKIKINRIGLIITETKNVNVKLYSNYEAAALETYTVSCTANQLSFLTLSTPKILDLHVDGLEELWYYFSFDRTTELVKNNPVDCGCGGAKNWMEKYVKPYGFYTDSVSKFMFDVDNGPYLSGDAMGMVLDVELSCDGDQLICENYNYNKEWRKVLAHAVRYKAGELLCQYILDSHKINRYTMLEREHLYGKRNHFRAEYAGRVFGSGGIEQGEGLTGGWLSQNIDPNLLDCVVCSQRKGPSRKKLLI